ncbi:MAG: alpha/beta hydrolase [Rhodospirillaceae bacterium]|jgi:pimeloyl-ACP methyl ester carboxylesterase|nr:alpha/beta hydrolase [Rhodospirillaceae bacterium]MBT7955817.1 alpha/beta hydrolase [Rhodospirillaceae bacterium]
MKLTFWGFIQIAVLSISAVVQADELFEVPTRPGVTVRTSIIVPDKPKAVAVLFAGSHGTIKIRVDGTIASQGNFLIAARQQFAKRQVIAVAIDAPSDQIRDYGNMQYGFRESSDHVTDIGLVIAALKQRFQLPVWLVGTSRGTTSVAYAASKLQKNKPHGIVLTSSMNVDSRKGGNLLRMELAKIVVPALVVHHKDDGCRVTTFLGAEQITRRLVNAPVKKLMAFEGGKTVSDPCGPKAHHGYLGQRGKVVKEIVAWMLAHQ